jgi:hypothetical protein
MEEVLQEEPVVAEMDQADQEQMDSAAEAAEELTNHLVDLEEMVL